MLSFLLLSLVVGESHGYDEYTTCDSQGRSSRQLELPSSCDMTVSNFCYDKGQAYPDKAIKRFLRENLGLMKRMSSDMDSREVVREMRSGFNMWTQTDHYDDEGLAEEEEESTFQINMMPPGENIFNGLKYNIKYGSGLATIKNVKDEAVKQGESSTSHTTMMVTTSQSVVTSTSSETSQPPLATTTSNDYIEPSTVTEQVQTSTINNDQETTYTMMQSRETPTEPPVTVVEEFYPDYYPDYQQAQDYSQTQDYSQEYQQSEEYNPDYPVNSQQVQEPQSVTAPEYIDEVIEEVVNNDIGINDEELIAELEEVIEEEIEEEIEYIGESVNACEVEESVTAPYWALNTRNDTLALLNLYPFEQYIHMEKCKAEHDEMLCRPGCRCEQQYRLHRLLAFDPKNECRGIFSDWFRFPSFCICKCYNSAKQFKELTRNPKSTRMSSVKQSRKKLAESRLNNHRLMSMSGMDDMPAVFPYEGLAMITDEKKYNRDQRDYRVPRKMDAPQNINEGVEDNIIEKIADEHMDNTVESDQVHYQKNVKQPRLLDSSFFHNQPILDFKLADGSMGSVEQVPRK